ncbi:MAG TPA: hypothetical protein VG099_30405 [Gemmataceae bacterium]|nr:hypothetical protein [Gemmataceae bacterium]
MEVIECCSGKTTLALRELESKGEPVDACFAPDSSAVAVCFAINDQKNSHFLKIFALPSGQERYRLNLTGANRWRVIKWESNRVFAQAIERHDSAVVMRRGYSFALGADFSGEGRPESLWTGYATPATREEYWDSYWVDGPGWVAHSIVAPYQKTGIDKRLEWLGKKIGVEFELNDHLHETIRFLDPDTGQVRSELPSQLSYLCTISEDGKRVACLHPKHGLEVWNAQQPRWPWSTAAGFATAGGMLLFGRWRKRREMKRQIRP